MGLCYLSICISHESKIIISTISTNISMIDRIKGLPVNYITATRYAKSSTEIPDFTAILSTWPLAGLSDSYKGVFHYFWADEGAKNALFRPCFLKYCKVSPLKGKTNLKRGKKAFLSSGCMTHQCYADCMSFIPSSIWGDYI